MPQIEVAVADNATALVLRVWPSLPRPTWRCCGHFAAAHGVRLYLQPAGLESVRALGDAPPEPLRYRAPYLRPGRSSSLPTDFIQVNGPVNEALVARAAELLELTGGARVLDLYCGLGNFTLALASGPRPRWASRASRGWCNARAPMQRATASPTSSSIGADLAVAPLRMRPGCARDTATCCSIRRAPGRMRCSPLARLAPERVLYISCHPGSLARDLMVLVHEHGFTLEAAGVVDMFAHTAHVESLALLRRA